MDAYNSHVTALLTRLKLLDDIAHDGLLEIILHFHCTALHITFSPMNQRCGLVSKPLHVT
jgi:hypothetical protein